MKYKVVVLRQAKKEIAEIGQWIAERSVEGALRWLDRAERAIESLETHPESHGLAPEDELVVHEIRQMLFATPKGRTYRAVFTISGNEVHVLHVRGPGQQLLRADELADEQADHETGG